MEPVKENYDVIIVGGGPSGSACAIFLGRQGHDVLLVDKAKFPRDKACGDGITGKSKSILEELNLVEAVEANPHGIFNGALVFIIGQKLDVDFEGFYGHVSRRMVFDNIIFQEAKKLVDTLEGFTVTGVSFENKKAVGIKGIDSNTKEERVFRAKIVVGADGANSVVAREVGLSHFKPDHHASALRIYYKNIKDLSKKLEIYFLENQELGVIPGYFWIFPLENNMANVGVGMSTNSIQKYKINLQDLLFKEIKTNPLFVDRFKDAEVEEGSLRGWNLPIVTARRKMYGDGFVLLGDAASLIDPFTGEGIGPGLVSAKVASGFISDGLKKGDYSGRLLKKYQDEMWRLYVRSYLKYHFLSKIVGNFRWLVKRAFRKFANDDDFKQLVTMTFSDTEKRRKFTVWTAMKLLFKAIF